MRCSLLLLGLLALLRSTCGAADGAGAEPPPAAAVGRPRRSPTIARARRGAARPALRARPRPPTVTPGSRRGATGLEDLDRSYPAARRRADEEVLKLLGLIEPDVDLRNVSATRLRPGRGRLLRPAHEAAADRHAAPQTSNALLDEITLAHELTHALEDQRFGLDARGRGGSDDAALARLALVEGTATAVMFALRASATSRAEQALGGLLARLRPGHRRPAAVPQAQLVFPYIGGQAVRPGAAATRRRALGRSSTSPTASARRPRPSRSCTRTSTCAVEQPLPVRLRRRACSGRAGARVAAGTWGEWQTGELLGNAAAAARRLGRRPLRAVAAPRRRRLPGAVPAQTCS